MKDVEIIKSKDNLYLQSVKVYGLDYSPQDVFYTIAQGYKEVLIKNNVYINSNFPATTLVLDLDPGIGLPEVDLETVGADFYFDADGLFLFQGEFEANPDRAGNEFFEFFKIDQVIYGPHLVLWPAEADMVITTEGFGKRKNIYHYND